MADRSTNIVLEKLLLLANPTRLRQVFSECLPYVVFLSRNRYSSHVFQVLYFYDASFLSQIFCNKQAMLSRQAYLLKSSDSNDDATADNLTNTILSFASPLLQNLNWLSKEISASHVIRSTICLLAGLPMVAERKVFFPFLTKLFHLALLM